MDLLSNQISDSLSINKLVLDNQKKKDIVTVGKNVVFAIDVSGSMSYELKKIRQQLKNKIPSLISERDTVSIIWFSGKSQAGILKEGVKVKNLMDLQQLNDAIDRFLVPIGLTAFLPPINLLGEVIDNLSPNGNYFSFIFLSDGYNNDSAWKDITKKLGELESKVSNATFIEYGYYADSNALTEMSEIMGGEKIFAKDFDSYDEDLDKIVKRNGSTKRSVDISNLHSGLLYPFLYLFDNENQMINVLSTKDKNEVLVSEDVEELYFFSNVPLTPSKLELSNGEMLASAFVLAERLKYQNVEDILVKLGDVDLINKLAGAYGKQKLNELKDSLKECTFNSDSLFKNGKIENYTINPNQYSFIDLIKDLQDGENFFYPYNDAFNYNRIGGKKKVAVTLDESTKEALSKAKTLSEITAITSELSAAEFIYPDNAGLIGMSFKTLVFNQERANLSVQTRLDGKVKVPKNDFGLTEVDSFIFRNFTLVKDGVINVSEIPVSLDIKTLKKLDEQGLKLDYLGDDIYVLNISSLPTVNRSMINNLSAIELANEEYELIRIQLCQKYLKYLKDEYNKANPSDVVLDGYTPEQSEWLKSIGISSGGFAPKTESVKTDDFYVAPVLKVKIEKTSTQPKISDYLNKAKLLKEGTGKPFNLMEGLLDTMVSEMKTYLVDSTNIDDIEGAIKLIDKNRRKYLTNIARIKFALILSRSWFKEFETLDENELSVEFDGLSDKMKVTFDYKEEQIKL